MCLLEKGALEVSQQSLLAEHNENKCFIHLEKADLWGQYQITDHSTVCVGVGVRRVV